MSPAIEDRPPVGYPNMVGVTVVNELREMMTLLSEVCNLGYSKCLVVFCTTIWLISFGQLPVL